MKVEVPISDFSRARAMYTRNIIRVVRDFRRRTRNDVVRSDWWSQSYSTSDIYSRYLGMLLVSHPLTINNSSTDVVERDMEEIRLVNRLIDENSVKRLLEEKRKSENFHLLDLMSYGALHRELGVTGCMLALSDRRREGEATDDRTAQRELIVGDVLSGAPWRRIESYTTDRTNGKKFGVVLCNPMGGLENIPSNTGVYRYIFSHVYRVLSSDDGVFLTTFHNSMYPQVREMCEQLNTVEGIAASSSPPTYLALMGVFSLRKSPIAPERLPIFDVA